MNKVLTEKEKVKISNRVGMISLFCNGLLAVVKIFVGFFAHSQAMVADGVHTVSDVISTVAVMIGVFISTRPDDKGHPYGHEKIEAEVAKLLAVLLLITGVGIGYTAINTMIKGDYNTPGILAVIAAILSIIVKEWMYHYTVSAAKKINSTAMKADAWHHRSDALSSIGTLIGISGAIMGVKVLDAVAGFVVSIMIIKVAVDIYIQAVRQTIDHAADDTFIESVKKVISDVEGVKSIDEVKTRMHGARYYVDVEIGVDGNITVQEGHDIAETIHDIIETQLGDVKHCMVHVNPK